MSVLRRKLGWGIIVLLLLCSISPLIAMAAFQEVPLESFAPDSLGGIANTIRTVLNVFVGVVMALALVYFFFGLAKYIKASGDEEAKGAGRSIMINGVIALFVMAAVWGLVQVLTKTFSLTTDSSVAPKAQNLWVQ